MPLLNINEHLAKSIITSNWTSELKILTQSIQADSSTQLIDIAHLGHSLVLKPDMLFGKRYFNKLVFIDLTPIAVIQKIKEKSQQVTTLKSGHKGYLSNYIIEPYIDLSNHIEHYLLIKFHKDYDEITYSNIGGVNIENNQSSLNKIQISTINQLQPKLAELNIQDTNISDFISGMYEVFVKCGFLEIEINPFVVSEEGVYLLDCVAKIDSYAKTTNPILKHLQVNPIGFSQGENLLEQEVNELNLNSGASLKLNILNPNGQVWGLYSGGGASLALLDTLSNQIQFNLIANYGEYSGNPTYQEVYNYTNIILKGIKNTKHGLTNYILISGAIANFTNVQSTLEAISKALEDNLADLDYSKIKLYVRRSGPKYLKGLQSLILTSKNLGIDSVIHGHEIDLCSIVNLLAKSLNK
jgi:succinyl-CoA synthetase beta subunit